MSLLYQFVSENYYNYYLFSKPRINRKKILKNEKNKNSINETNKDNNNITLKETKNLSVASKI